MNLVNLLDIFSKTKAIISVGENSALISIYKKNKLIDSLLVAELNEEEYIKVSNFFRRYKKAMVYILLDTVAQNYNLKSFPAVSFIDIFQMVKRALRKEKPSNSLGLSYYIDRDSVSKKWNYMFVFAALESPLSDWLDFLYTTPNRVMGIYMYPIELQGLIAMMHHKYRRNKLPTKRLKSTKTTKKRKKEKKDVWELLILQNSISGLREAAFKNGKLIFTRLLNNASANSGFVIKFKDDLLKTIEYLRRIESGLDLSSLTVYTILNETGREALETITDTEFKLINFTPKTAGVSLNLKGHYKEEDLSDEFIKKIFISHKKKLKFNTVKMSIFNRFYIATNIFRYISVAILISIISVNGAILMEKISASREASVVVSSIKEQRDILIKKQRKQFGVKEEDLTQIEDIGSLHGLITEGAAEPYVFLSKVKQIQKNYNIAAKKVEWKLLNYNFSSKNPQIRNYFSLEGKIINPEGNVEVLFKKFDSTLAEAKRVFPQYIINTSKLPADIDFNRAYYDMDFSLRLEGVAKDINPYRLLNGSSAVVKKSIESKDDQVEVVE